MVEPEDEVARLVSQAQKSAGEEDETSDRRVIRRKRKSSRAPQSKPESSEETSNEASADEPEEPQRAPRSIEELDIDEMMPRNLPRPDGTLKSLGDLYAKFGVGRNPEMRVHLYRTYPKIGPGGMKLDGFYDEYDVPITEQQVQADYGGGQYRIVVVGPNPTDPSLPKHYGSHSIQLAGPPNVDRMPKSLRRAEDPDKRSNNNNPLPLPLPAQENPKITEVALKMFEKNADMEREERRRMERKMEEERTAVRGFAEPIAEAERRRADDLIRAERERSENTQRFLERQLEENRAALMEAKRQMESMNNNRPSIGSELRDLAEAGIFSNRGDDATREMFNRVLEKHKDETQAINKSHAEFVHHLRTGHASEIAALREAHARELVAEREASRSREERIEDRLRAEREERRRDQEKGRQDLEQRDVHWKDRLEQALQVQQNSWEARHQSLISTYENRSVFLQQEIDRLKQENYDLRTKQEEKGDITTQLLKMKEFGALIKEIGGADAPAPVPGGGGGLGLTGGDDWKAAAAEAAMERLPAIVERLFGGGGGQQGGGQGQQQFVEGQVVQTPNGVMEVVRDPASGQLALAPKAAMDEYRASVAAQQRPAALPQGGGGRVASRGQPQRRRPQGVSAVPNLAEGLPKRRPPWEGGGDAAESRRTSQPAPQPAPQPRMTTRSEVAPAEPLELNNVERQALRVIAKEVHESVSGADDPDEFVARMMGKYPPDLLKQIVGEYSDRQIVQGVMQMEPRSAGATPAGQSFMLASFQLLRQALA
jgi:hypothetical protein